MANMISSGIDVVAFLEDQHRQIEAGFLEVIAASGDDRKIAFLALRRLLAVHETAEEEVVHPAARRALPDGEVVILARLQEENEAKRVLSNLEDLDVESAEFGRQFVLLKSMVLRHAKLEEQQEFARMADVFDESRLESMKKAVDFAERTAPTRPHPGIESAAANLLVGPFASMLDRVRDAIAGKP